MDAEFEKELLKMWNEANKKFMLALTDIKTKGKKNGYDVDFKIIKKGKPKGVNLDDLLMVLKEGV